MCLKFCHIQISAVHIQLLHNVFFVCILVRLLSFTYRKLNPFANTKQFLYDAQYPVENCPSLSAAFWILQRSALMNQHF